ncbi:Avirulence (Avh) protein [Phytophthora megakarya]|uniref:Avirulence (Avh) protein n=1 Tax=Phytophthora megakarya TaxID=4795 RepID=A0A225V9W9_9STRA|nr:Avirulence (Avh) protein [Phytophthora megakarya]
MKLKRWAKNDKSLDEVQKLLSMEGLSGTALTSHKNYKYLKQYLYNRQGEELKHMVFQDLSTFEVWKKLGLDTLSKNPTVILKDTEKYNLYKRYVNYFDKDYSLTPSDHKLKFDGSIAEKTAKVEIWAEKRVSVEHVKEMLGLRKLGLKQLERDPDYPFYVMYLKKTGKLYRLDPTFA